MTIETRFSIGDEVWSMENNKPIKEVVIAMGIDVDKSGKTRCYLQTRENDSTRVLEDHYYTTKRDLIESLFLSEENRVKE